MAKEYRKISHDTVVELLRSPVHEQNQLIFTDNMLILNKAPYAATLSGPLVECLKF